MKQVLAAAVVMGLAAAGAAAQEQQVVDTMEIDAPASAVWKKVRNFGDLASWLPVISTSEIELGDDNVPGAVRLLTLPDGGKVREELLEHDEDARSMTYSILEAPEPIKDYRSTLKIEENGAGSRVVWTGSFEGGPEMVDFFHGIYQAGLTNLKQSLESH